MARQMRLGLRYTLRTLLLLITIVAIVLGRISYVARTRQAALAAIAAAGGRVSMDAAAEKKQSALERRWRGLWGEAYARKVASIDLKRLPVGDEIMPHVAALPEIRQLELGQTKVTDQGMRQVRGLRDLRYFF